jgi:hypothetical protein
MKIRRVRANNRRKVFEVETDERTYPFPYALLRLPPSSHRSVSEVFPDKELGCEAFTYRLEDGEEDTIHLDAVLEYNRDPGYLNQLLLHRLTVEARAAAAASDLSKREMIRALGTSASQLYRLLDPTNRSKSVGQMFALLHVLGREVDVVVKPRHPPVRPLPSRRGAPAG